MRLRAIQRGLRELKANLRGLWASHGGAAGQTEGGTYDVIHTDVDCRRNFPLML